MEGNLVCNLLENMLATLQKPLSKDKVTPVNVRVSRDGEGYLASVEWTKNLFAYGHTEEEAKRELVHVIDMMIDYNLDEIEKERWAKNRILQSVNMEKYAL